MDVVDVIVNKDYDKGNKLIKLYAVIMLNYRTELGDKAWNEIAKLFADESLTTAFSFLMGFATGASLTSYDISKYEKFITADLKELDDNLQK